MKAGGRGQVTIPKAIRKQLGMRAKTEVDFSIADDALVLRIARKKLKLEKWKGRCEAAFQKLGYSSVDRFLDDIRGR